jgi:hypothetical protein
MKKLLLLLALTFLSAQSFAGSCPDGSDPVKSVSDDGTYYVYNCGGQASSSSATNSKAGTVEVAMKPNTGDWLNESIFPKTLKEKMLSRYDKNLGFAMGDFNNDGVDDLFHLGSSNIRGLIDGAINPEITNSGACDVSASSGKENCYSSEGHRILNIFSIKDNVTYKMWNTKKNKWDTVTGLQATDVSDSIVNKNPIEMSAQGVTRVLVADFNGDGVLDIFFNDAGTQFWDGSGAASYVGKNDHYYLSQADGTWLESTVTHVTGEGVKKGRGLENFTHAFSVGDIDNDGDIDVVVTSLQWVGNNGQLLCYVNQGDGHMIVRRCGDQFGWRAELGDIDNDGDLDIVFGGNSLASKKEWANVDGIMGDCQGLASCPRAFNGILLNDGTGNFFQRGFSFPDAKSSYGFTYHLVPTLSVADLDGDGDLDVVRSLVGRLYAGMAMSIEENIGNGQFRTVFLDEWCKGPKTKADWPVWEGSVEYNCWGSGWMFGDFNKDGFVDIVVDDGEMNMKSPFRIIDSTVYLSTGKFKYDAIRPDEENYPLADFGIAVKAEVGATPEEQALLDEFAEFEAQLEEELAAKAADATAEAADAIAKRKAKVAAAKAERIAEEEAKAAETESSPLFDGRYSFTISRYNENEGSERIGQGFIEINNGIMTVAKEGRTLDTGSIDLYDSFEGQIDKKGNIMSSLKISVLFGVDSTVSVDLNGSIDSQLQGKWDHYYDAILKLGEKE